MKSDVLSGSSATEGYVECHLRVDEACGSEVHAGSNHSRRSSRDAAIQPALKELVGNSDRLDFANMPTKSGSTCFALALQAFPVLALLADFWRRPEQNMHLPWCATQEPGHPAQQTPVNAPPVDAAVHPSRIQKTQFPPPPVLLL